MLHLPVCQHCHTRWTYIDTLKNLFRLRCSYCGEKNYFSRTFRWREPIFFLFIMGINFFLLPMLSISFGSKLMIILIILFLYLSTAPFGLKLTEKEEPFF